MEGLAESSKKLTYFFKHPHPKRPTQDPQTVNANLLEIRLAKQNDISYLRMRFSHILWSNWFFDVERTLDKMPVSSELCVVILTDIILILTYNSSIRPFAEHRTVPFLWRCRYLSFRFPSRKEKSTATSPILSRFQIRRKQFVFRTLEGSNTHAKDTLWTPLHICSFLPSILLKIYQENFRNQTFVCS